MGSRSGRDRRKSAKRHGRRLPVTFRRADDGERRRAYSTNISTTGIFIATNAPLPPGTRLRLEIHGERGFVAEGVVVHAARVPATLQSFRSTGMGIRFLQIGELVQPLLPKRSSRQEPADGPGDDAPAAEEPPSTTPERDAYPPSEPEVDVLAESGGGPRFAVRFEDAEELLHVVQTEIDFGGVFVHTTEPAALYTTVTIDLHLPPPIERTLSAEASVVRLIENEGTGGGAAADRAGVGMGVAFADPQQLLEELRPLLESLERDGS